MLSVFSCAKQTDVGDEYFGPHTRPMSLSASVNAGRLQNVVDTRSGLVDGTSLPDDYTVHLSSYFYNDSDASKNDIYFTDKSFRKNGSVWKSNPVVFWPFGGHMSFLALACVDSDFDTLHSVEWSYPDCTKGAVLSLPDGACAESEILFGNAVSEGSGDMSVALKLYHSQSWLSFLVGAEVDGFVRIERIVIRNAYDGGSFKIDNTLFLSGEWSFRGRFRHDVVVPGSEEVVLSGTGAVCDILLPEQGACDVVIEYRRRSSLGLEWSSVAVERYVHKASADPWYYGMKNIYEIAIGMTGEIEMKVDVEEWRTDDRFITME